MTSSPRCTLVVDWMQQDESLRSHLTSQRNACKLRPVRTRSLTAVLMAWFLIGSGICLCLAAVPVQPDSPSHDCSNEPAVPASEDEAPCESGCTADDAVKVGSENRTGGQIALWVDAALINPAIEPAMEPASSHVSRDLKAGPAPNAPAYILHSVLLV